MKASEHFEEAFGSGVGSPELQCICGRTHCAPDSDCLDDGEAERMHSRALENPAQVILHPGDDAVSAAVINGSTVVRCCTCNWFGNFEDYVWNERERILRYYKFRRDADAARLAVLDGQLMASAETGSAT